MGHKIALLGQGGPLCSRLRSPLRGKLCPQMGQSSLSSVQDARAPAQGALWAWHLGLGGLGLVVEA